jgi:hypothetical protein
VVPLPSLSNTQSYHLLNASVKVPPTHWSVFTPVKKSVRSPSFSKNSSRSVFAPHIADILFLCIQTSWFSWSCRPSSYILSSGGYKAAFQVCRINKRPASTDTPSSKTTFPTLDPSPRWAMFFFPFAVGESPLLDLILPYSSTPYPSPTSIQPSPKRPPHPLLQIQRPALQLEASF